MVQTHFSQLNATTVLSGHTPNLNTHIHGSVRGRKQRCVEFWRSGDQTVAFDLTTISSQRTRYKISIQHLRCSKDKKTTIPSTGYQSAACHSASRQRFDNCSIHLRNRVKPVKTTQKRAPRQPKGKKVTASQTKREKREGRRTWRSRCHNRSPWHWPLKSLASFPCWDPFGFSWRSPWTNWNEKMCIIGCYLG